MFATPNTLRNVIADLKFYSKFGTINEITITIQDFDDGEGAMVEGETAAAPTRNAPRYPRARCREQQMHAASAFQLRNSSLFIYRYKAVT